MAEEVTLGTLQPARLLPNSEFQKRAKEFWAPLPLPLTGAITAEVATRSEKEAERLAVLERAATAAALAVEASEKLIEVSRKVWTVEERELAEKFILEAVKRSLELREVARSAGFAREPRALETTIFLNLIKLSRYIGLGETSASVSALAGLEKAAVGLAEEARAVGVAIAEEVAAAIPGLARLIGRARFRMERADFADQQRLEVSAQGAASLSSSGQSPISPITTSELENRAQTYAEEMLTELDTFNTANPLAEGESITTGPDREELMKQFKQLFYQHVAEQRVVIPG